MNKTNTVQNESMCKDVLEAYKLSAGGGILARGRKCNKSTNGRRVCVCQEATGSIARQWTERSDAGAAELQHLGLLGGLRVRVGRRRGRTLLRDHAEELAAAALAAVLVARTDADQLQTDRVVLSTLLVLVG